MSERLGKLVRDASAATHGQFVLDRRMRVLAEHLGAMLPAEGAVLDAGCGNGEIARAIQDARPGLQMRGIDIMARPTCAIPMESYDGKTFPLEDGSVDFVMFVDVLHHTDNALDLLVEAKRVARQGIVIKDHRSNNVIAGKILAFMDYVGNRPHGVVLPYNYWSSRQWEDAWDHLGAKPDRTVTSLGLYPLPFRPLFEYGLHFISRIPLDTA